MQQEKFSPKRKLWSACLGNLFEHYDTALFGFLSPFLAPLLFPKEDPLTALLFTYTILPLGMLVRPLGSLFFGYIGDTYGRKRALFLTLAGMSCVSGGMALIPSYATIGSYAPLLFCLARVLQNFLAAGETVGSALFLLENSSAKRHDLLSGIYNATTIGGHFLAAMGVFLLSRYHLIDPGWRALYILGCLTGLFGFLLRSSSDMYIIYPKQHTISIKTLLLRHKKALLAIVICSGFGCACYSVALVLINGLIPLVTDISIAKVMQINTYMLIFDFCMLPAFGWIASRVTREMVMLMASFSVTLLGIPLFLCLEGASLSMVIVVRALFVLIGVAFFAPFYAWAKELVPPENRYAIISFGYALGSQIFGAPTAALSLYFFHKTGRVESVALYWILLSLASSFVMMIYLFPQRKEMPHGR